MSFDLTHVVGGVLIIVSYSLGLRNGLRIGRGDTVFPMKAAGKEQVIPSWRGRRLKGGK